MSDYLYLSGRGGRRRSRSRRLRAAFAAGVIVLSLGFLVCLASGSTLGWPGRNPSGPLEKSEPLPEFGKKELAEIIGPRLSEIDGRTILDITDVEGRQLFVRTTIDPDLQSRAERWVRSSLAHQAALVVMKADSGEVLTLAGYRADGREGNAALDNSFPAASLFKIVTAAAAVEKADYSAESSIAYDGGKYTLYKKSLARGPDRGIHRSTLEMSFAESINTVFGKLGIFSLGSEELVNFAERFGFNHDIEFELPVAASSFSVGDDEPFHLAELASGYNRSTKVSPLHGAMMAASVASGGRLVEPTVVKEIFDLNNRFYYQGEGGEGRRVVSEATAEELARMMLKAVEKGTGRRGFSGAGRHPVLSKLLIGGKSGSINNDEGQRVDWFVAWARPKDAGLCSDTLALSAVVVHGAGSATNSQKLIRQAIVAYYKDRLEPKDEEASRTAARPAGAYSGG